MANKNIITSFGRSAQVGQTVYSPVAILPPPINQSIASIYCFIGRVVPWVNDLDPDAPTGDEKYIKSVMKNIIAVKKVTTNGISPVIPRVDWTSGVIYDYYRDDIDMVQLDLNGNLIKNFYVKNRYDQVFKCLWNQNDTPSTYEPFFQPGTYGTNNIFQSLDGYKWKYMYTITAGSKRTFMDSVWMPVPINSNPIGILDAPAALGDIEVINIINGGSGYSNTVPVTIQIIGDGYNASANAEVSGGKITNVVVANTGTMYSQATAIAISANGSGAILSANVSPRGGHGYDPALELGCNHVMLTAEFNGTEDGLIPTNSSTTNESIDYRQVGVLVNATARDTYPYWANADVYSCTTDLIVASGYGDYRPDEVVFQSSSGSPTLDSATFVGTVVAFNPVTNKLSLINTTGIPVADKSVIGSQATRTVLTITYPKFIPYSGAILYIENRSSISRSADGTEQIKFVSGY
jgi:hypothetical protein